MQYRLYFFVPYNLSEIQKGIQAGHAALEFARVYGLSQAYQDFIKNDKTWIILNGGTTRDFGIAKQYGVEAGSLDKIAIDLISHDIPVAFFREPDLNYALTAVCFLADERVWNREMYPDFQPDTYYFSLTSKPYIISSEHYDVWVKTIGGTQNAFLRELIKDKRLA